MFSDPRKNLEQFDVAPGMKVADFGSGVGHYAFLLGQIVGSTGHVFALDVQKELLVTLKREAEKAHLFNVEVVCADFDTGSTKLKSDFIERGIVANVLFQLTEKEKFVKEVARVLKTGGKILVVDWSDSFGGIGPDKKFVLSKTECQSLFEKVGFVLEKNISAGLHHYGFVFKKV
jgi:ubiquinone/menaquinone biosynthesis C-methylase UbiE